MTTATFPRWTRIVAPVAALWYAFDLAQCFIGYMGDAAAAPLTIWAAYALACVAGLIGSAALAFAPARAPLSFGVSLLMAATYFGWVFAFGTPAAQEYGIGAMVIGVTLILMLVARRAQ